MTSSPSIVALEKQTQEKRYAAFVATIRAAAKDGVRRLKTVVDDYDFDCSRWAAGPRKATAIIGLRVWVECTFALPPAPPDYELRIDTSHGGGCWLTGPGIDDDDPDDVMLLAFEGQDRLLQQLTLEALIGRYNFRTLSGLGRLSKRYRADDYTYRVTPAGVTVSFVAEMEAY